MVGVPFDPRNPRRRILPPNPALMPNPAIAAGTLTEPYNPQELPPPPGVGMPPIADPRAAQMQEQQLMNQQPQQAPQIDPTAAVSQFPKAEEGAQVPEENLWSATGKTDDFGSWFNKRNSSDALTAFGAAMLKAPTFMQGLGDAALAVNQVDRENRMPTTEEIARANIKARMANGRGASPQKVIQTGYDNVGNPITQMTSADGGPPVWYDGQNREMPNGPTNGFVRSQDSGLSQRGKDGHKYLTASRDRAELGQKNMATYDTILETAPHANVGSGLFEQGARGLASLAGVDIGEDQNLEDTQVFNKYMRNLELQVAQTQKGLGQFTEMERKIVKESIPSIDTQAGTIFRVTVQMKLRDQLDIELYQDYMDMPESRRGNFEEYAYDKRKEQAANYEARYRDLVQQELNNHPDYQKYQKKSDTKKESQSILDEADAIVN
jgi:hypothetical protein